MLVPGAQQACIVVLETQLISWTWLVLKVLQQQNFKHVKDTKQAIKQTLCILKRKTTTSLHLTTWCSSAGNVLSARQKSVAINPAETMPHRITLALLPGYSNSTNNN